ncbi:SIR2 family protein [Microlunatus aurantiacus]
MDVNQARRLDSAICSAVTEAVDATGRDVSAFTYLASWAGRMETHRPIEIFTVNYDLLIEAGLEEVGVPYFDGFVGGVKGRFAPELIEPSEGRPETRLPVGFVRLWKLHGSTNWKSTTINSRTEVVRTARAGGDAVAIYPSDEKYDDSRRLPFVALMDRFRRALVEPETLTLVCGYSWGDEHLNEMLFDAAQRHPRSEIVALCFGVVPPAVAQRAASTRNLMALSPEQGIIDGQLGTWISGADIPGVFESGRYLLGDFARTSAFLARQVGIDELSA